MKTGMSDEAARKAISRQKGVVKRLAGNLFPNRERFLYIEDQFETSVYFENLLEALKETESVHFGAISALALWGGKVSLERFRVLSGAPEKRKKHKNFDRLLVELTRSKLLFRKTEEAVDVVELHSQLETDALYSDIKPGVLETLQNVLIGGVRQWLQRNRFGSFNSIRQNHDFNSYYWDLTAPTYLFPLMQIREDGVTPAFTVVDILPQYDIGPDHITFFMKKFKACRSQYKSGRFFPILIGNSFTTEAFEMAIGSNILVTTPGNLFGEDVQQLIDDLKDTLTNFGSAVSAKSDKEIVKLISAVSKFEGRTHTIRGALFELLCGAIVHSKYGCFIEIGKKIRSVEGKQAEIDVFCAIGKRELRFYECKGYNSHQVIDEAAIEDWKRKIKRIRSWLTSISEYRDRDIHFEYWATCPYSSDATSLLNRMKSTKKYTVEYGDIGMIKAEARSQKLSSIGDMLRACKYFCVSGHDVYWIEGGYAWPRSSTMQTSLSMK